MKICLLGCRIYQPELTETGQTNEFDVELYFALTEKVVVHDGGRLMMVLLDGTAVECTIE